MQLWNAFLTIVAASALTLDALAIADPKNPSMVTLSKLSRREVLGDCQKICMKYCPSC